MLALSTLSSSFPAARPTESAEDLASRDESPALVFDDVYEEHFDFVWRSARRLGVHEGAVDDVVQDTFLVVHRRLADFERRSSLKTWIFGILLRVARDHRRHTRRKAPHSIRPEAPTDPETLTAATEHGPHERAAQTEAVHALHAILDELDDEKREVFILADIEQLSATEIARTLGIKPNTVSSRLRLAREAFNLALARHRARGEWRTE